MRLRCKEKIYFHTFWTVQPRRSNNSDYIRGRLCSKCLDFRPRSMQAFHSSWKINSRFFQPVYWSFFNNCRLIASIPRISIDYQSFKWIRLRFIKRCILYEHLQFNSIFKRILCDTIILVLGMRWIRHHFPYKRFCENLRDFNFGSLGWLLNQ